MQEHGAADSDPKRQQSFFRRLASEAAQSARGTTPGDTDVELHQQGHRPEPRGRHDRPDATLGEAKRVRNANSV